MPYERAEAWRETDQQPSDSASLYKLHSGNEKFKATFLTWVNLSLLLLGYPLISLLGGGPEAVEMLKQLGSDQTLLMFALITTIIMQWFIYGVNWAGLYHEGTGLAGVAIGRIRGIHFAWAIAFLLAANLLLAGLAWVLAQVGLPMPGEIALLIPESTAGKGVWVLVSFTAGFCEEVAFRGYIMTRLRLIFNCRTWVIPTIVSAITFGVCHAYQGIPGLIVISAYGLLFSLLYIRTGSLWPCIIAHFFQDFMALIIPR